MNDVTEVPDLLRGEVDAVWGDPAHLDTDKREENNLRDVV